jgi:hypothetical protein
LAFGEAIDLRCQKCSCTGVTADADLSRPTAGLLDAPTLVDLNKIKIEVPDVELLPPPDSADSSIEEGHP